MHKLTGFGPMVGNPGQPLKRSSGVCFVCLFIEIFSGRALATRARPWPHLLSFAGVLGCLALRSKRVANPVVRHNPEGFNRTKYFVIETFKERQSPHVVALR